MQHTPDPAPKSPAKRSVPVLGFIGTLCSAPMSDYDVRSAIEETFGPSSIASPVYDFHASSYYCPEMGPALRRRFFGLSGVTTPSFILDVKDRARLLESHWAEDGKRRINIDPGYLDAFKVVLISEKYSGRKIDVGRGYYADVTLMFEGGRYHAHDRSFPDFRSESSPGEILYEAFFQELRRIYLNAVKPELGDHPDITASLKVHPLP